MKNCYKNSVFVVMAKPGLGFGKCWIHIRNKTYPDPRDWLSFEDLTFKHLKLVGFLHKQ